MRTMLVIGLLFGLVAPAAWPQCRSSEHRQFDFWIGDWDAYDLPDTARAVARIQVTNIMDGCALREVYVQQDGLRGESFSLWDASRAGWHQSWVTNRGALLLLEGRLEGGRMVLTAPEWKPDGSSTLLRGMWWPEGVNVSVHHCNIQPTTWIRSPIPARPLPKATLRYESVGGPAGTDTNCAFVAIPE